MFDAGGSRRVWVGVTGHRRLADERAVAAAVDDVLDRVAGDGQVGVLTSLAEGADRLVADRVLARGGALVALLPLAPGDYATDFADGASVARFYELLDLADEVEVVVDPADPEPSREVAYERAGRAVLERCEVLVALWDGAPARGRGGTEQIVAEARRRGAKVEVVPVRREEGP